MAQELFREFQVIVVPGLHNSSPDHWQSLWHARHPEFFRVEQDDWEHPDLPAWTARLNQLRARDPRPALLVAHSLGCLATVASIAADPAGVAGALLVAPADPHKFGVVHDLPHAALPAPSMLIASRDDPWMAFDARDAVGAPLEQRTDRCRRRRPHQCSIWIGRLAVRLARLAIIV